MFVFTWFLANQVWKCVSIFVTGTSEKYPSVWLLRKRENQETMRFGC